MATVIVEVDQFDATITAPDDGDTANAASLTAAGVGFQPLANRTKYLRDRLAPATSYVTVPLIYPADFDGFTWLWEASAKTWYSNTASDVFDISLPTVPGHKITALTAVIKPSAGSYAAAGTLAQLALYAIDNAAAAGGLVQSVTDPAASAPAYDLAHELTLTLASPRDFDPTTESLLAVFTRDDAAAQSTILANLYMTVQPVS